MNAEAGEDHSGNVAGAKEEIEIVGLESDVLDGDYRRRAGRKAETSEGHIVGFETGMRKIGGMKILENGSDGETFFETLGDAGLGKGPVSGQDDAADKESKKKRGGCEEQRFEAQI